MKTQTAPTERKYYLDWLRVAAILTVFIYHSTRFFDLGDWHIKNPEVYRSVSVFQGMMEIWMMPLIFVISGASVFYALNKGGAGKYFKDKFLRLGVPLIVAVFTHASWQVYLERVTHLQFQGSYLEFLPHYFDGIYLDTGVGGNFAFAGMHLWYLLVLLVFSAIFYPLFCWLKGSGQRFLNGLGNFLAKPGAMYLLVVPLILVEWATSDTPVDELDPGGWNFALYACFFLSGFLLYGSERLQERIRQARRVNLGIGLVAIATLLFLFLFAEQLNIIPLAEEIDNPIICLGAWSLVFAFLGSGMQRLNYSTPALKYANEAVLPFYILHQSVLLTIGFLVVQWQIPDLAKWLIIVAASFTVIMGLYELLIRRINLLRFLFGMKRLPKAAPVPARDRQMAGEQAR
jgi:peptidoglycan/LPS O-acetylase OafA/YrhL